MFNFLATDNTHIWLCTYSTQSISGVIVEFYDYSQFSAESIPVRFGNISIIGDSYSTYKYWIPNNNPSWYCTNGIDGENAMTNDVSSVMQTWWYKLCQELPATLLLNDSYSGASICNYAYNADQTSKSFVTRMKSCLGEDKALLPKPDIIIIFGGTNDDWGDSVVGSVKYGNWTTEDLNQVLPSVCYMFDYIKKWNPSAIIINVVNNGLDNSISDGMAAAAEHYNIYNLPLLGISKTSQHPNVSGMNAIKNQIISFIRKIIIGI